MSFSLFPINNVKASLGRLSAKLPETTLVTLAKVLGDKNRYPNLDAHLRFLIAIHNKVSGDLILDDFKESRVAFRKNTLSIINTATKVDSVENFQLSTINGNISLRLYRPIEENKHLSVAPLIIFFHGGGFVVGDLDTHDEACRIICKYSKASILSVDYRLSPENPAPAAINDGLDVLKWVFDNTENLKIDSKKIAVAGDSAGGNIAAVLAQQTIDTKYKLAGQLLFYPALDLRETSIYLSRESYSKGLFVSDNDLKMTIKNYVDKSGISKGDPLLSPIFGQIKGLCPTYIVIPEYDVLKDENEIYCEKLSLCEISYQRIFIEGQTHGFINYTSINKSAENAIQNVAVQFGEFLKKAV